VLILFYTGDCDRRSLALALRDELPGFMVPSEIKKLEQLPKLPNGKYDMKKLEDMSNERHNFRDFRGIKTGCGI
jgi:Acyl-CoA synthetases (AMP-forming)/AMP-acid ligases II